MLGSVEVNSSGSDATIVHHELPLEFAFIPSARHGHEVEDIGIPEGLPGKIRGRRRLGPLRVRHRLAGALVEFRLDVVGQYIL
jgi:hypothetical protein